MSTTLWLGLAAALASAFIGSGWQLVSRHGVTTTLGPLELALLRYAVPAVLLLPVWWRVGLVPRGVGAGQVALMVATGGLPFGLVVLTGAQLAPAAHMGVFIAGALPLFTALAGRLAFGEQVTPARWVGLAVVGFGVLSLGHASFASAAPAWRGDLLFLLAAALWSVYTVAFRRSGLTPWQGTAVVNGWSAVLLLPLAVIVGAPKLATAPLGDVVLQATWQGGIAGLLGLATYLAAVLWLGSARAALSAALVPVLTAAGGAWLLGEPLDTATRMAVLLIAAGIVLASGAVRLPIRQ
ncbi:MAG TPA: DMT family transporter [Ramlibacter sp.]|jgi:drug/metabolite transporter (DMT)-like permease